MYASVTHYKNRELTFESITHISSAMSPLRASKIHKMKLGTHKMFNLCEKTAN